MDTKQRDALVAALEPRMDAALVEDVVAVVSEAIGDSSALEGIDVASLVAPRLAAHLTDVLSATISEDIDADLTARLARRITEEAVALADDVAQAVARSIGSSDEPQLVVDLDQGNLTVEAKATVANRLAVRGGDDLSRLGVGVHGSAERLSVRVEGNVASITGSGNLTVTAPPEMLVDVSTERGNLNVRGFRSGASARTVEGNIHATDLAGSFDANARRGNIHVYRAELDHITVTADEGNIHLAGAFAGGEVLATAGNVHLSKLTGGDFDIEAESGNVHLNVSRDLDLLFDVEANNIPSIPGGEAETAEGLDGEVRVRAAGNVHIGLS